MTGKITWMSATMLGGMLMLSLSACSGTTHLAYGGVGTGAGPGSGSSGTGDGSAGDGSGGSGDSGGAGSGGGTGAGSSGGTGGAGGTGGTGGTGSGATAASAGTVLTQTGPLLVTAGNATLGLANATDSTAAQLAGAVPITAPLSGTVTKVLNDTGQLLVNVGNGRTLLLDGAQGVVGDVLSINVGNQGVVTAAGGKNGLVGLGVAAANQPQGMLATVGVLDPGQVASATVNGVANVSVVNVTGARGGLSNQLLNVAVADHQLLGSGNPAVINAGLLNGASKGGLLKPVTTALANAGTTGGGAGVGGVLAPVTSAVSNGAGGLALTGKAGASASAGATTSASTGGVLKPVTTTVSGLTGKTGTLLTPATNTVTNLTGGLTAR